MLGRRYFASLLLALFALSAHGERGEYRGCFQLNAAHEADAAPEAPVPPNGSEQVAGCLDWCAKHFQLFASISMLTCHCLNAVPAHEQPAIVCNARCTDDAFACGSRSDPRSVSVYDVGLVRPGPVTELRASDVRNTTVRLRWQHVPHPLLLREYRIRASLVRAPFAGNSSQPATLAAPEWILPGSDAPQIDLSNLRPGSVYRFEVAPIAHRHAADPSGDADTAPDAATVQVELAPGWPEPEPQQPRILGATDRTRTIELPLVRNEVGPVSRIRLVVVFEDPSLVRRDFDPARVVGFGRSQDDGLNYYIAAELEPYDRVRRFTVGDGRTYGGYVNEPLPDDAHVHVMLGLVSGEMVRYSRSSHDQHSGLPDGDGSAAAATDGTFDPDAEAASARRLVVALIVACCLFGTLLLLSVAVYTYMRIRLDRRMGVRRDSDLHELRPHVTARSSENGAYVPDELVGQGQFQQKLGALLAGNLLEHQRLPRTALKVDTAHFNVLCSGRFGDVVPGTINGTTATDVRVFVVAVDDMEPPDMSMFLNAMDAVLKIMPHANVLRFMGVCQSPDWLYVVFEAVRQTMKQRLLDERTEVPGRAPTSTSPEFVLRSLYGVAQAIDYLGSQGFYQRFLCAHQVGITVDDDVRLIVFAAECFDREGYRIEVRRWQAPESLRHQNFSRRSDAWTFGCLMWEMCNLGATPFANVLRTDKLADRLKAGDRPGRRLWFLLDDLYQLMLNCWQPDPADRPSLAELSDALRNMLTAPRHALNYSTQLDCEQSNYELLPYLPDLERDRS